ncbi:hypothetical protein [Methylomonas methanica]|uniref:Uncharacterized protein n=1 Tax=Methylomonas methanica (strain DSM 25384 / MC09) TaxID=857087 RepID=F9ZVL6_METMM|nr:hypothetical protein [Methylomonas methanica]AEG01998.1 hypothetical protein Metme_3637 [Methylomonas methanica MC09]
MHNVDFSIIHDAQLLKVELKNNFVELLFKLVDETVFLVILDGIERMLCNSLKEGNTILSADVINDSSKCTVFLNKLFELNDAEKNDPPDYLLKIKEKINSQELVVFHISPSYGCELIALCKRVVTG